MVALKMSRLSVANIIAAVESILVKMEGNTNFTTPNPDLILISKQKDDLKNTAASADKGNKADKALVPVKKRTLILSMSLLRAYVQDVANSNAETAVAVATSSGMQVTEMKPRKPRIFSVKNLIQEGAVKVICPREKGDVTFEFAYTPTPLVVASYINIGALPKSTRTIMALSVGIKYSFTYRVTTKDGTSDWSDVITMIVT